MPHPYNRAILHCFAILAALALSAKSHAQPIIEGYSDYALMKAQLQRLAESEVAQLTSLGTTLGDREVLLLTVAKGNADERPAILILGSVEAPHLVGSEIVQRMAAHFVGKHKDEEIAALLDRYTLYFIPRPNPDASEFFFKRPYDERLINLKPTDADRDGAIDEDPTEDLNGDGLITMMRVADPAGEYLPHPDDARLMVKADPKKDERGKYLLYTEGRDNDGDERFNEDGSGGVDLNRNFTFRYPYYKAGAGPNQVSEVESRAVADFAFQHPNIALVLSFSPQDNLASSWKFDKNNGLELVKAEIRGSDKEIYDTFSKTYKKLHKGKKPPATEDARGALAHWAYFHYGCWSLSARAWWPPEVAEKTTNENGEQSADNGDKEAEAEGKQAEEKEKKPSDTRAAREMNALRWLEQQKIDGFVDWQPIEHPDFPDREVEVGGFTPYLLSNPPAGELDDLAEVHRKFVVEVLGKYPQLRIDETEVKKLGDGVYRLTADVVNDGEMPTSSEMGRISKYAYPPRIELELPEGTRIITGDRRTLLPQIDGKGGRIERRWVLVTTDAKAKKIGIQVESPTAGTHKKEVTLK